MRNASKFFVVLVLSIFLAVTGYGKTIIIANSNVTLDEESLVNLSRIFTGDVNKWSNGDKAVPVDQKKDTPAGQAFLNNIVKMSDSNFQSIWVEKMLSGEAEPPAVKNSDSEVVSFVKNTPGAVGYIDAATPHNGVKVISVDGKKEW